MKSSFLKIAMCFFMIGFVSVTMHAQKGERKDRIKEKVKTQKVAFITERLDLSESEAQKFWPIYDAYQYDLKNLKSSLSLKSNENITDKEADEMIASYLDGKSREIDIQKRYFEKLKTVIPSRKVASLFRVEREFKEEVVSSIRKHHMDK